MATDELTFRISGLPDFWAQATREVINANTTLLDAFNANASGEVVLHGWTPKVFDFMMKLLHHEDDELNDFFDEFEAEVKDVWSIASFHEKFIQHAHAADEDSETHEPGHPTLRMRQWFRRWYEENGGGFRGASASDLTVLVMPAFYIGDAQAFMSVTHDWFLHVNGRQASSENVRMPEDFDQGGVGVITTNHPLFGQLAAARSNMIGKIEVELNYDEKKDGLPRGRGRAYYKALFATGWWPVERVVKDHSIHQTLTMIENKFDYVNYDNRQDCASLCT
ncbi:hypothetical protein INS49_007880 [Diaporthe citri]|uniref:uncharacterized protein n=1 Tax=Diaporthe citri TaxID=83186 RepID=UPI001C825141|nr:uncharacterized protein INS49_007880 [Diaporthe citri]KAG6362786.1 hypothetical protein INS49_007880 [Diaporthe citri]